MNRRRITAVCAVMAGLLLISIFSRSHGTGPGERTGTAANRAVEKASEVPGASGVRTSVQARRAWPSQAPPRRFVASREMQVPTGLRLMVISPHPDDESLGASGLIQRVRDKDGKIQVLYVTNGDGYLDGVRRELGRTWASDEDFIEYGELRHDEAIQALTAMGIDPSSGVFLGFPDGGIDDLWTSHWSRYSPYTSPYTHLNRPSYEESLNKRLLYSGDNLQEQISQTLTEFMPDWVVLPDPRDEHSDHSATGLFVLDAIRRLKEDREEGFEHIQVFTYLVHFTGYPGTKAWAARVKTASIGGFGAPCLALASTQWMSLSITGEEIEGKRRALAAHKSQIAMTKRLFDDLTISYEIFGRLDSRQVMIVPRKYAGHSTPNS